MDGLSLCLPGIRNTSEKAVVDGGATEEEGDEI